MLEILKYEHKHKRQWDKFITTSKNGVFLFYRDYMDYHSDRYQDHSLMFFMNNHLKAVLPGNIKDNVFYSHQGLTFGGIVTDKSITTNQMLTIFTFLIKYLQKKDINQIIYKAIPYIYHSIPSDEDLYSLFLNDAKLIKRDVSPSIYIDETLPFQRRRNRGINSAVKNRLELKPNNDYKTFMKIVNKEIAMKYNSEPTHTVDEIEMLAKKFPDNIKLFGAYNNKTMIAGAIIYESKNVAHAQYIFSNNEGRKLFAQDMLVSSLILKHYNNKKYFDLGTCTDTDKGSHKLNKGLIEYKESYGARVIAYDTYEIDIN